MLKSHTESANGKRQPKTQSQQNLFGRMHVVAILLIILGVAFVITMGSAMVADLFEGRRKARQNNPGSPQRNPIKKSQTNTVTPTSHL